MAFTSIRCTARDTCATWCGRPSSRAPAPPGATRPLWTSSPRSSSLPAGPRANAGWPKATRASGSPFTPRRRPTAVSGVPRLEALGKELSVLARDGRFADMPARVPDALLDAVAVSAAPPVWARPFAHVTLAIGAARLPGRADPGGRPRRVLCGAGRRDQIRATDRRLPLNDAIGRRDDGTPIGTSIMRRKQGSAVDPRADRGWGPRCGRGGH